MDFLATILAAVAPITGKYRRVHRRVQSQEKSTLTELAQLKVDVANMQILSEALQVCRHVGQIGALRVNLDSFENLYPAATKLRTMLGGGIWARLEHYRGAVTYLAFSTFREKETARNDLPTELNAFLNENTPYMETYIRARYGKRAFNTFQRFQNSLLEVIEGERRLGIEVQKGGPMKFLMRRFRSQPIFWLMQNLNFPVEGRMTWDEVSMWAIQCLKKSGDIEPPSWPIELRGLDEWNWDATGMWNEAVIEVYEDIRRRFCGINRLHLAV